MSLNPKNIIVPGLVVAVLGLMFVMNEEAKAAPGPGPGPGPNPGPGPGGKAATIDGETSTPGAFAKKYGGDWAKWKEIASANPGMIVVDKPFTIEETGQVVYQSGTTPNVVLPYPGLVPWNMGQVVNIPSSW